VWLVVLVEGLQLMQREVEGTAGIFCCGGGGGGGSGAPNTNIAGTGGQEDPYIAGGAGGCGGFGFGGAD
jgi:hypothetical protein